MIPVLRRRELNRATLARQMLLARENLSIVDAFERLAGLQSQLPNPPYLGLWTWLEGFQCHDLTQLITNRQMVRAAYLRSTLHLITATVHQRFCTVIQSVLIRGLNAFFGQKVKGLDADRLKPIATSIVQGIRNLIIPMIFSTLASTWHEERAHQRWA